MVEPDGAGVPFAADSRSESDTCADAECRALVRVPVPRSGAGARLLAAVGYFAWLGYLTAPLPLLLLNLRAFRRRQELAYHAWNATAWSVFVTVVRGLLGLVGTWTGVYPGPLAQGICNAVGLVHLVLVLSFALLLSSWYSLQALCGRRVEIPILSRWVRARVGAPQT
jgi:hypothetical protein